MGTESEPVNSLAEHLECLDENIRCDQGLKLWSTVCMAQKPDKQHALNQQFGVPEQLLACRSIARWIVRGRPDVHCFPVNYLPGPGAVVAFDHLLAVIEHPVAATDRTRSFFSHFQSSFFLILIPNTSRSFVANAPKMASITYVMRSDISLI